MPETLIGIDIGTTAVKAVLVDLDGRVLAEETAPYPTARLRPAWVEQDPADWERLALAALAAFAAGHDLAGLRGIGLTGQVNTHVFVDAALRPVRPAIVWQDARAAAEAAALDATVSAAEKLAWFGAPMPIDASHALSRMAWVAAREPDAWAATAHVLAPKDFLFARLTGAVAADPLDAVGRVRDSLPCAGVPVTLGTMDAWAGMFGVGVATPGQAMYLSGTSEILGLIAPVRVPTPGVIVFPEWRGLVVQAAPTQAGGAALDWLAGLLGRAPAELADAAGEVAPSSPLFLPHLEGERAPLWDPAARGAFAGLTTRSGAPAMTLAVMEGVAFSARLAFEALEASAGLRAPLLQAGGGGMRSDRWCQLRADAFGRPLRRMAASHAAALGAAVCAGVGCGAIASLAEAAAGLVRPGATFDPGPGAALADERLVTWRELYAQICPINDRLGRASDPLPLG